MFIVPTCLLECALAIYKPELLWSPSISPGAEPAPPQLFPILINVSDAQVRKTGGSSSMPSMATMKMHSQNTNYRWCYRATGDALWNPSPRLYWAHDSQEPVMVCVRGAMVEHSWRWETLQVATFSLSTPQQLFRNVARLLGNLRHLTFSLLHLRSDCIKICWLSHPYPAPSLSSLS